MEMAKAIKLTKKNGVWTTQEIYQLGLAGGEPEFDDKEPQVVILQDKIPREKIEKFLGHSNFTLDFTDYQNR